MTTSDQIRFVGGLPVDRRSNSYLDIRLPTIVVPDLVGLSDELFYINGQAVEIPADRKIELADGLSPGVYELSYGDCRCHLRVRPPTRSLEHVTRTLVIDLDHNTKKPPIFRNREISEISSQPGLSLAGAKFFGQDIPLTTWAEVEIEPKISDESDQPFKSPADLISSVVRTAIRLKQDTTAIPKWFDKAIDLLDQNIALRALVQRKLLHYRETALSYADLRRRGGD